MPKRVYKILRFDGGINNDSDPRDIGDNQCSDLQDIAVDEVGKIKFLGDCLGSQVTLSGAITSEGTGLIAVKTDYDGFCDGGFAIGDGGSYYVVENGEYMRMISTPLSNSTESASNHSITGLSSGLFYFVKNGLRIMERDHSSTTTPKVRIVVPVERTYGVARDRQERNRSV